MSIFLLFFQLAVDVEHFVRELNDFVVRDASVKNGHQLLLPLGPFSESVPIFWTARSSGIGPIVLHTIVLHESILESQRSQDSRKIRMVA